MVSLRQAPHQAPLGSMGRIFALWRFLLFFFFQGYLKKGGYLLVEPSACFWDSGGMQDLCICSGNVVLCVPLGCSAEVSIVEVGSAIRHMRLKAALGLNDIPMSILKENLFIITPWLVLIYMASLSLHHFLESWKTVKVIPLKKPSKSSYSTPNSYQSISLISQLISQLIY